MASIASDFTFHSAYDRPDLVEIVQNPFHPLEHAWPAFVQHTSATKLYWKYLVTIPQLAIFQILVTVTEKDEETLAYGMKVVARAHAVPFNRPLRNSARPPQNDEDEFEPLPNGGWDFILEHGVSSYLDGPTEPRANTLSALSITIDPAYRRQSLAERIIGTMKEKAQRAGFRSLIVPLRPTLKAQFPDVDMGEYARWTKEGEVLDEWPRVWQKGTEPFDPWLRKHVSLGAQMIKVAPYSMSVEADLQSWTNWTGLDIRSRVKRAIEEGDCGVDKTGQEFVVFTVAGALNKAQYFPLNGLLRYVEANIWVQYAW